jgi:hypothetical protein
MITELHYPPLAKLADSLLLYEGVPRLTPESYEYPIDDAEVIAEENLTEGKN